DRSSPFYYEFFPHGGLGELAVTYKALSAFDGPPNPPGFFTLEIHYQQGEPGVVSNVVSDNPYHHFTNIDYRTSNKRVYLPWKQGDSSSVYARNSGITSYGLKYRRLGAGDVDGNFVDPYSGVSPFYDPYT